MQSKQKKADPKDVTEVMDKIEREAAAQNKTTRVYLSEQSNGLREMFIRWLKAELEVLENIKSERE